MFKFDLSKFQKTAHDDTSATLRHKDGHEIKIALKPLSPKLREQMSALPLAEGGEVQNPKLAESKKQPPMYAEGTEEVKDPTADMPNSSQMSPGEQLPQQVPQAQEAPVPLPQRIGQGVREFGEAYKESAPLGQAAEALKAAPGAIGNALTQFGTGLSGEQPKAQEGLAQGVISSEPATVKPPESEKPLDTYAQQMGKGINQQIAGAWAGANAAGELGQMNAADAEQHLGDLQQRMQKYEQTRQAAEAERQSFIKDVKDNHIEPNRYLGNKGALDKIMLGITMAIGGAGSGAIRQENSVGKFLDDQINRDIMAQKANLDSKQTLLSANLRHSQDINEAMQVTSVMMRDVVALKLQRNAEQMRDPIAKAAALKEVGEINQKNASVMAMLNANKALTSGPNKGNIDEYIQAMRFLNPERAKELESRYVPGVGLSSVPLTSDNRDAITGHQEFQTAVKNVIDFAKSHRGQIIGPNDARVKAMQADLSAAYRKATQGGVFKKGEQAFIDTVIPGNLNSPFNAFTKLPRLEQVSTDLRHNQEVLHKNLGLPMPGAGQQSSSGIKSVTGIKKGW